MQKQNASTANPASKTNHQAPNDSADLSEMISLKGKRALVCGASQGIGRAIAELFIEAGADLILVARNAARLAELQESWGKDRCDILPVDLENLAKLQEGLVPLIKNRGVDILINNSGGPKGGELMSADLLEFERAFAQHILAAQTLATLLTPHMKSQHFGRIVNVISTSVRAPIANLGVSNTIRGAMASWSKTLANELGPYNITVNNILPGYTATERLDNLATANAAKNHRDAEAVKEDWRAVTPLRRFAEPRETACAALFLVSAMGGFVSGVSLPVDGGRLPVL